MKFGGTSVQTKEARHTAALNVISAIVVTIAVPLFYDF